MLTAVFIKNFFTNINTATVLVNSIEILLIIVVSILIIKLITIFSQKISKFIEKKTIAKNERINLRINTIKNVTNNILIFITSLFSIALILSKLGLNIAPIIAGASIFGLAVGLGVQNIVKDLVNGVFILYEDQYGIGDSVSISGFNGTVEDINIRTTILRDFNGNIHIIPNGEIKHVTVKTKDWSCASVIINLPIKNYKTIITEINKSITLFSKEYSDYILEQVNEATIENVEVESVSIHVRLKTKPSMQSEIENKLKIMILNILENRLES